MTSVWTEDRIAKLRTLIPQGLSRKEMGYELGVSASAIGRKIKRLGVHHDWLALRPAKNQSRPINGKSKGTNLWILIEAKKRAQRAGPPPPQAPITEGVGLWDLTMDKCHWPLWTHYQIATCENNQINRYCGEPKAHPRLSYCKYHCRMAYQPVSRR